MRRTADDLYLATGYKLTERQADALSIMMWMPSRSGSVNSRTGRALRKLGLADAMITVTPRGRRRVTWMLTGLGTHAARHLADACEYGAHVASIARLSARYACDVWDALTHGEI
jgi:hypothetical protein